MASNYARLVRNLLTEAGCKFDRQGNGDHEIWLCPKSRRPIVVDNAIKSRHTANGILKQAGLQKAF
jgi:hypothetical protein